MRRFGKGEDRVDAEVKPGLNEHVKDVTMNDDNIYIIVLRFPQSDEYISLSERTSKVVVSGPKLLSPSITKARPCYQLETPHHIKLLLPPTSVLPSPVRISPSRSPTNSL